MRTSVLFLALLVLVITSAADAGGPYHVYTVQPCRIADTRIGGGSPLDANTPYGVFVAGLCGVPFGAAGAFINVIAIGPDNSAWLTMFPYGTALPTASTLNFTQGQTTVNGAMIPLCDPVTSICDYDLVLSMGPAKAHIVIDVTGFLGP